LFDFRVQFRHFLHEHLVFVKVNEGAGLDLYTSRRQDELPGDRSTSDSAAARVFESRLSETIRCHDLQGKFLAILNVVGSLAENVRVDQTNVVVVCVVEALDVLRLLTSREHLEFEKRINGVLLFPVNSDEADTAILNVDSLGHV